MLSADSNILSRLSYSFSLFVYICYLIFMMDFEGMNDFPVEFYCANSSNKYHARRKK